MALTIQSRIAPRPAAALRFGSKKFLDKDLFDQALDKFSLMSGKPAYFMFDDGPLFAMCLNVHGNISVGFNEKGGRDLALQFVEVGIDDDNFGQIVGYSSGIQKNDKLGIERLVNEGLNSALKLPYVTTKRSGPYWTH